ncbi:MAG: methyl-accepting chemotaxis protein [Acidobacteriota bacterium]
MPFSRKYLLHIVVPPTLILVPIALLFIGQVEILSPRQWTNLLLLFAAIYVTGGLLFWREISSIATALTVALEGDSPGVSRLLSATLRRTWRGSVILWWGAGSIFAVLATVLSGDSPWVVRHYATAAVIIAVPATSWAYAWGKKLLTDYSAGVSMVTYEGPRTSVGTKLALTFVGLFVVSALALLQLVSSRVSFSLERLAISSATERFNRMYDTARLSARVDADTVETLQDYVPAGYQIFKMTEDGAVVGKRAALTPIEVLRIRRIGTGDSTAFSSPHVIVFRALPDGNILGMTIPWEAYAAIPVQITLYTLVITLFTTLIFVGAALFISSDVRRSLRNLGAVAAEMARGDFIHPTHVFSDDEIGELADSFGETRENLRRLLGKVGGGGSVISEGVHLISGGTGALVSRSRRQSDLTDDSTQSLEKVKAGIGALVDAAQKSSELAGDTSTRSTELQASSEEIARSMDHLFQSVEKTTGSITQISASALEMSGRGDVLSAAGEDVVSFVAEMEASIEELRQSSRSTATISQEVQEAARSGGEAVRQTVEGIELSRGLTGRTAEVLQELQTRTEQITRILEVIEGITEQTNLLALNAAIIAAQSGEEGRGFTVVANQIRELSERTRGSTREISTIVRSVYTGTREAVGAVQQALERANRNVTLASNASTTLLQIATAAESSHQMATRISSALEDQSRASRHLHEISSRMSDQIREINRSTTEQASGTGLLGVEAERVRDIALQVRNSTDQQSAASRGITRAMEQMAAEARDVRDLLERQLEETERIAGASRVMLEMARENDSVAQEFNATLRNLLQSGQEFETEVKRFRIAEES